jgi:hypothetical protein
MANTARALRYSEPHRTGEGAMTELPIVTRLRDNAWGKSITDKLEQQTRDEPKSLADALTAAFGDGYKQLEADILRAILEARGLEIREKGK